MSSKVDTTLSIIFIGYFRLLNKLFDFIEYKYCNKEQAIINIFRIKAYLNKCKVYIDYSSIALDNIVVNIKQNNF
jgi:hypothetical protein